MPKAIRALEKLRKRRRLLYEITLSIYFPWLLIEANWLLSRQHNAGPSWVDRIQRLFARDPLPSNYDFAYFLLWFASAMVIFTCLRLASRYSLTDFALRIFGGLVTVTGFPLLALVNVPALLNNQISVVRAMTELYDPRWLGIEVIISIVSTVWYALRRWPPKWGPIFLALHTSLWLIALRTNHAPGFAKILMFGFIAGLAWGLYISEPHDAFSVIPGIRGTTKRLHENCHPTLQ